MEAGAQQPQSLAMGRQGLGQSLPPPPSAPPLILWLPASQQIPELIWAAVLGCPSPESQEGSGRSAGEGPTAQGTGLWERRHTRRESQNVTPPGCLWALPLRGCTGQQPLN